MYEDQCALLKWKRYTQTTLQTCTRQGQKEQITLTCAPKDYPVNKNLNLNETVMSQCAHKP